MIQVSIQDTGLGIKEEDQPKIFGKFMRADDNEALKSPGTGLGLNITKSLIEMHGGHIWFESKFREGTTFHFALPVAKDQYSVIGNQ
jgi:signal transduction histidine kinase